MKIIQLFNLNVKSRRNNPQVGRVYDPMGLAPTLTTMDGGNRQPMIMEKTILYRYPHGYFEGGVEKRTTYPSLLTNQAGTVNISKVEMEETKAKDSGYCIVEDSEGKRYKLRIRKLTPKECLRLMDVRDEDADKMLEVNSNSQVYKQAGNSIVVACMEKIFHNLFIDSQPERKVVRMRQIPMF